MDNTQDLQHPRLLIIGGDADPNIVRMVVRCNELGIPFRTLLMGQAGTPNVTINVRENAFIAQGEQIFPQAVFIRPNVYEYMNNNSQAAYQRAQSWFDLSIGWMLANRGVRFFNRRYYHRNGVNKLETLLVASSLGFFIPETYFTNDLPLINEKAAQNAYVEKPVDGGAHTQLLKMRDPAAFARGNILTPITVQQKLVFPEIRIFRIGDELFAFRLSSDKIDYRDSQNTTLHPAEVPEPFRKPFFELTEYLGLEYAAADLKTDEATGQLALLEVNSGPMYMGFDQVCGGALSRAMIQYLTA